MRFVTKTDVIYVAGAAPICAALVFAGFAFGI